MFLVVVMMVMMMLMVMMVKMLIMIHCTPSQVTHSLRTGPLCPSLSQPIIYTKTSKWVDAEVTLDIDLIGSA